MNKLLCSASDAKKSFFFSNLPIRQKNIIMYWYTREIIYHLFIKYACERNVINICNNDIIIGMWSDYSHRIDTYGLTPS